MLRRITLTTTVLDLLPDSDRCDDEAHRCGTGDPDIPARLRPRAAARLVDGDCHSFRASHSAHWSCCWRCWRRPATSGTGIASSANLTRPALLLLLLVCLQATLGALVVMSGLQPIINTAHVVNGALVLGTSLVLTLRVFRHGIRAAGARWRPGRRTRAKPRARRSISARYADEERRARADGGAQPHQRLRRAGKAAAQSAGRRIRACRLRDGGRRPLERRSGRLHRRRHRARRRWRVGIQPGHRARSRQPDAAHSASSGSGRTSSAGRIAGLRHRDRARRSDAARRGGQSAERDRGADHAAAPTRWSTRRSNAARRSRPSSAPFRVRCPR